MANQKSRVTAPVVVVEPPVTMSSLPRDTETKVDLGPKLVMIRDLQGFASAALSAHMQTLWGVFTAIETGTDEANSLIYLYKGDALVKHAVQVNRQGNQNAANFSLMVPLAKLRLRPNPGYQWEIVPREVKVVDGPPVFVLDLKERKPIPRNLQAEAAEKGDGENAKGAAAKDTPAKDGTTKAAAAGAKGAASKMDPATETRVEELRKQLNAAEELVSKLYGELDKIFGDA